MKDRVARVGEQDARCPLLAGAHTSRTHDVCHVVILDPCNKVDTCMSRIAGGPIGIMEQIIARDMPPKQPRPRAAEQGNTRWRKQELL